MQSLAGSVPESATRCNKSELGKRHRNIANALVPLVTRVLPYVWERKADAVTLISKSSAGLKEEPTALG